MTHNAAMKIAHDLGGISLDEHSVGILIYTAVTLHETLIVLT